MRQLPEKWTLHRNTEEAIKLVEEWVKDEYGVKYTFDRALPYFDFPSRNNKAPFEKGYHQNNAVEKNKGYVEITLDEFKALVLKQNSESYQIY